MIEYYVIGSIVSKQYVIIRLKKRSKMELQKIKILEKQFYSDNHESQ